MAETLVQPDKLSDSQSEYMKLIAEIMEIRKKGRKAPCLYSHLRLPTECCRQRKNKRYVKRLRI